MKKTALIVLFIVFALVSCSTETESPFNPDYLNGFLPPYSGLTISDIDTTGDYDDATTYINTEYTDTNIDELYVETLTDIRQVKWDIGELQHRGRGESFSQYNHYSTTIESIVYEDVDREDFRFLPPGSGASSPEYEMEIDQYHEFYQSQVVGVDDKDMEYLEGDSQDFRLLADDNENKSYYFNRYFIDNSNLDESTLSLDYSLKESFATSQVNKEGEEEYLINIIGTLSVKDISIAVEDTEDNFQTLYFLNQFANFIDYYDFADAKDVIEDNDDWNALVTLLYVSVNQVVIDAIFTPYFLATRSRALSAF